ncbi:SRPBCC family protein [Streptomyces sp. NRRL B-3229]|uniref:SRPBCC family protein n=1 Tax=Streptomyces sp. NRRL B-3229 TaxID=1463836 RepID=UPI0004BEDE6D|nr:SRPBCC family protein [Streptomyces sp. NRRL B-3229]
MAADLTGTYLTLDDGRPAVRFSRTYDHPADRVWRFVTDADELAHWFPSRAEIELRPGGAIRFSGDPHMPDSTGRVLAVDEPRHLSFEWGGDELHFDLEELDDKRTRFTLTNVLLAADTAARNGAGWEVCLAALDAHARGEHPESRPWKDLYEAYVDAGIPSGAPVPGTD